MSLTSIIFLSVCCVGGILCLVRSPAFGIYLYEFVYFLNPKLRWWYGQVPHIRYSFYIVLMILISFILRMPKFAENRIFNIPQFKWLAGMTGVVVISYFWSVDTAAYEMLTIRFLKYIFFMLLMFKVIDSSEDLDIATIVYVIGIFYICFIAWQVGRTGSGRLEGIGVPDGEEVNGTAAAVVTGVPILVYMLLFFPKKWMQFAALIGLTFVLNGLVLLNSRGAFLALIISMSWFSIAILRDQNVPSTTKRKLVAGIVGSLLLFFYLADDLFWERMRTLESVSAETEGGSRVLFWLKTFEMLKDHPLGMGAMGYQVLSSQYMPAEWLSGGRRAVHSTWFEVLGAFGYQGLIFFIGYVTSTFGLAWKVKKYMRKRYADYRILQLLAFESSFIAFLVAATFVNRFFAEMLYWLPAFIAAFANIYMIKPQRKEVFAEINATG